MADETDTDRDRPHVLRVATLKRRGGAEVTITPDAEARAAIAGRLGIDAVRKLSFAAGVSPDEEEGDWRLDATLGATVVQACVATLAPVTTRIDRKVSRRFLRHMPDATEAEEVEMPEDETIEPLAPVIDVAQVMEEALAIALPDYPRVEDAPPVEAGFAAPGTTPMTDADTKPFAGLAGLKGRLEDDAE